ncbi:MAG: hypothetical protein ACYTBJ_22145 [Planctomycetota bacterium]|jgi:hypothetical protein
MNERIKFKSNFEMLEDFFKLHVNFEKDFCHENCGYLDDDYCHLFKEQLENKKPLKAPSNLYKRDLLCKLFFKEEDKE